MKSATEQELRLYVPPASRAAVLAHLGQMPVRQTGLHARYFDTPERDLAQQRIALRIRKEDQDWVQTLKAPGAHAIEQVELNHILHEPRLDLSLYDDHPVGAILSPFASALQDRFETRVLRRTTVLTLTQGTVELACDQGEIIAGDINETIWELEFERLKGDLGSVLSSAKTWLTQFGLILEFRSKAERADALASGYTHCQSRFTSNSAAADATALNWSAWLTQEIQRTLVAVGRQANELVRHDAASLSLGSVKRLEQHMLRLGDLWRLSRRGGTSPAATPDGAAPAFLQQISEVMRSHDNTPTCKIGQTAALVGSVAFQGWLLDLLAWVVKQPS